MTWPVVAFVAGGLSMWLLGLWLNRNSLIPGGAAALVFDDSGVSLRMPDQDGEATEPEMYAFGLFLLVTEDADLAGKLVRAKVNRTLEEMAHEDE